MSGLQLRAGGVQRATHPDFSTVGIQVPSVMISLSEPQALENAAGNLVPNTSRWRIRVEAKTETTRKTLGVLLTIPPSSGADTNRVIGIGTCPGAISWDIQAELIAGSNGPLSEAILDLASSPCCGLGGLIPTTYATLEPAPAFLFSDVLGPNPLTIPEGVKVISLTARAGIAGGLVTLNPGITIGIESNDSFRIDPADLMGPMTISFNAGILRWVIETSG